MKVVAADDMDDRIERAGMRKLTVELENCYGIKALSAEFDFSRASAFAVYAPNGSMKSSLAQTFQDVADEIESRDRVFPTRASSRKIVDENGVPLSKESVFVVSPYDKEWGDTEKTSTLLVNTKLRKEYEQLHVDIDKSKTTFIEALKHQCGSKKDIEKEVSSAFTKSDDEFYKALKRIESELRAQQDTPYSQIRYDTIFDEKVLSLLSDKDFKSAIEDYIKKYNELLLKSTYFKKGTFNYYHAATVAKNLADNGFFNAKHTVNLNAADSLESTSKKQLEELIAKEKEEIFQDKDLKARLVKIEKQITKNASLRGFEAYLAEHEEILPRLANIDRFKEDIWKSYIKVHMNLYDDLIEKVAKAEKRKLEIEKEATAERTQWENVIDIFNERFIVPFKLEAKNRISVILGQEPMLRLGFTFEDGSDTASVNRDELMRVLSTGELRAFYVLNIIFEVEARKNTGQETVFIVDDIADSFDYKNKYAIIQYLQDISEHPGFRQIVLTHNFDFFRTVNSRFVPYSNCRMVYKDSARVELEQAVGFKNIFVNDWKPRFFDDTRKRLASIPFIRNIVEYTKGEADPDYIRLTALLHWKKDTPGMTQTDLRDVYQSVFGIAGSLGEPRKPVVDILHEEARACLDAAGGINFENKIVLSIATRIAAEKFMVDEISDPAFVGAIGSNQTSALLKKARTLPAIDPSALDVLRRVVLMTPENIHLNSFMYEPILDLADGHLRRLYRDVLALSNRTAG